jgi:hypothetical protein
LTSRSQSIILSGWFINHAKKEEGDVDAFQMSFYSFFYFFTDTAIKEMSLPYLRVADFIEKQLDTLAEKYAEWQHKKKNKKEDRGKGAHRSPNSGFEGMLCRSKGSIAA